MPQHKAPSHAPKQTADTQRRSASSGSKIDRSSVAPPGAHRPSSASVKDPESPGEIHRRADEAMQGMGSPFPHARRIQESFGEHGIGHLRAFVDDNARNLTKQSRAKGMTKGHRTAFAKTTPSLHTAAHEAAHAKVYELSHVNLPGNVGSEGDPHEKLADQVADRVVAGRSAADLLNEVATGPTARNRK